MGSEVKVIDSSSGRGLPIDVMPPEDHLVCEGDIRKPKIIIYCELALVI